MQIVYRAADIIEANIVAGMLQANGIDAHVGGYYLQGGIGELAVQDFASVSVENEAVAQAEVLIAAYQQEAEQGEK